MASADGTFIPAAPPPEGVTPNFENPEWIGYRLIIVAVVFPVLASCFLVPRLWSAAFIIKRWHPDDYLICVGYAFALINSIVCIIQSTKGMGYHIWDLEFSTFQFVMKLGMIAGAGSYNLCTLFVKLSILSFYLRFSIDRAFRIAVYIVMFITVGYTLPNAFLFLWICRPMQYYWDWTIPNGTCINQNAVFDSANILNMVTDFMILLLPIWMLRPMRAPLVKKIGIALILMAGGFVCAISLMRTVTAILGHDKAEADLTWQYPVNLIWCLVEMYIGIVCACLPCLKAFVRRFFPNSFLFSPGFNQRATSSLRFPFSVNLDSVVAGRAAAPAGAGGDATPASVEAVMPSPPEKAAEKGGRGQYGAALAAAAAGSDGAAAEAHSGSGRRGWWQLRKGRESAGDGRQIEKSQSQVGMTEKLPSVSDVDLERGQSSGSLGELSVGNGMPVETASVPRKG
ncbi:hypothetical protein VTJ49DRAFT_7727 [Mycothermus thermophilus]|uniref:Rhodopsin domain-containing protein n=1 Tax=Humicola insolens TaxID=85995 RepID=A0ABR3VGF1_HUMIN